MSGEYIDAVRDVVALVRAYNKNPDPLALNGEEVQAILAGANPWNALAVLLDMNHHVMRAMAEARGEADPGRVIDTMLFALQSSAEMQGLTGG